MVNGINEHGLADLVMVGNGIAGMTAAIEARQTAPDLRIAVITAQNHPTISTPALKQFTVGAITREQLLAYPVGKTRDAQVEMIHATVTRIEAANHCLLLSNGERLSYRALLLATGSTSVGLPDSVPGRDLDGVLVLHRLHHYLDLARHLQMGSDVREAVVIGGGIHASETVASILQQGINVHWLIRSSHFHSKVLDTSASNMILDRFQRAGVSIWLETEVQGIVGKIGAVTGVVTSNQQFLDCQLVLVCTGTKPMTDLAAQCDLPLQCAHGFAVNDRFLTSAPDIYAAGDVAALYNPLSQRQETRPQWYAAHEQGRLVGAIMAGQDELTMPAIGVPWHSTTIEDLSLCTVGAPLRTGGGTETFLHNDGQTYRRVTFEDQHLVGYLSVGRDHTDGVGVKRLIDERVPRGEIEAPLLEGRFDSETFFARHLLVTTQSGGGRTRTSPFAEPDRAGGEDQVIATTSQAKVAHGTSGPQPVLATHRPWPQISSEVAACIGCNECLLACPALGEPLPIEVLNQETVSGPVSGPVVRFARSCYQCGACVAPCPVGLHRDAMMLWIKVRLLSREHAGSEVEEADYVTR